MTGIGSKAAGMSLNRHRYQGNEYIQEAGLHWMDFHNRQYDPQLGRFVQVDPMAAQTDWLTPYASMNNNPVSNVDPLGLMVDMSHVNNTPKVDFSEILGRFSAGFMKTLGASGKLDFIDWNQGAQERSNLEYWNNVLEVAGSIVASGSIGRAGGDGDATVNDPGSAKSEETDTPGEAEDDGSVKGKWVTVSNEFRYRFTMQYNRKEANNKGINLNGLRMEME